MHVPTFEKENNQWLRQGDRKWGNVALHLSFECLSKRLKELEGASHFTHVMIARLLGTLAELIAGGH